MLWPGGGGGGSIINISKQILESLVGGFLIWISHVQAVMMLPGPESAVPGNGKLKIKHFVGSHFNIISLMYQA